MTRTPDDRHTHDTDHDDHRSFAVYVFERHGEHTKRLSWLRESVCNDLSSALMRAELVRGRPNVTRVQVFEQTKDDEGHLRAGRIVRTFGGSRWRELLGIA